MSGPTPQPPQAHFPCPPDITVCTGWPTTGHVIGCTAQIWEPQPALTLPEQSASYGVAHSCVWEGRLFLLLCTSPPSPLFTCLRPAPKPSRQPGVCLPLRNCSFWTDKSIYWPFWTRGVSAHLALWPMKAPFFNSFPLYYWTLRLLMFYRWPSALSSSLPRRLLLGGRQRRQHLHLGGVAAPAGVRQFGPELPRLPALGEHLKEVAHESRPQTQRRGHGQRRTSGPKTGGKASAFSVPQPQPGAGQPPQDWWHSHHPARHPQRTGE